MEPVTKAKIPVDRLVLLISERTELYDLTSPSYHKIHVKEAIWRQIGDILGHPWDDCQKKWKYLRDTYIKNKKQEKIERRSGSEGFIKKQWKYMGILSFLDPHIQDRPTSSNFKDPSVESILNAMSGGEESQTFFAVEQLDSLPPFSPTSPSPLTPTPQPPPPPPPLTPTPQPPPLRHTNNLTTSMRRRRDAGITPYQQQVLKAINHEVDEHEHFLLSLAPTLRRLEPRKQAIARVRMQTMLLELEFNE